MISLKGIFAFLLLSGCIAARAQAASTGSDDATAWPRTGQWALGVIVGPQSGINAKVWLNSWQALDFAVESGGLNQFSLHADYLWHRFRLFHSDRDDLRDNLPLYFGVGGVVSALTGPQYPNNGNVAGGARGVFGITYLFPEPFDIFLEIAPTVIVSNSTLYSGFFLEGSLGGRYYF